MTSEPIPSLGYTYELEDELRNLRSAVWRMVSEVEDVNVTTEGGDIIRLLDFEADAVRRALAANEPGGLGSSGP